MKGIIGLLLTILSSAFNIIDTVGAKNPYYQPFKSHGGKHIYATYRDIFETDPDYPRGGDLKGCRNCGIINSLNKKKFLVINGDVVEPPYKYPWMVRLEGPMSCGGAIISDFFILTAAHCFVRSLEKKSPHYLKFVHPREIRVLFLTKTYSMRTGPEVLQVIPHPEFNWAEGKNDIGLIKLSEGIICDEFKNPVCLPPPDFRIPDGMTAMTAGWGAQRPGSKAPSSKIREGLVKHAHIEKCPYAPLHFQETLYCFEGLQGRKNWQATCYGDSGGPAFYDQNQKYYIIGVTSRGSLDCGIGQGFMFTKVPIYVPWIREVTGIVN